MATNILTKLNKKMEHKIVQTEEEKLYQRMNADTSGTSTEEAESLKEYEQWKADKTIIRVTFGSSDIDGNLYYYDTKTGITVVFMMNDIQKGMPYYREEMRSNFTGNFQFDVRVNEIDAEKKYVYCISARNPKEIVMTVNRAIQQELSLGNKPIVTGKITKVTKNYLLVDIFERGIKGYLSLQKWSPIYVRTLIGKCEKGDVLQFEVTKKMPNGNAKSRETCWALDRSNISPNPWGTVPAEWKKGTQILVTCIEKPEEDFENGKKRTFWWGQNEVCPDIEILCDYTTKVPKGEVIPGETYLAIISEISISLEKGEKNIFKVSPFSKQKENAVPGIKVLKTRKKLEVPV